MQIMNNKPDQIQWFKMDSVGVVLIFVARPFQSLGAATVTARSHLDLSLVLGTTSSLTLADLRTMAACWSINRSERYEGAEPFKDFKNQGQHFKMNPVAHSNQCKDWRTGLYAHPLELPSVLWQQDFNHLKAV